MLRVVDKEWEDVGEGDDKGWGDSVRGGRGFAVLRALE